MSNQKTSLVAISLSIGACLFGGADFIDFRADRTAEGWGLGETVFNRDRGRKFVLDGDAIMGPAAAAAATQAVVVVSVTVNNSPPPRFHVLAGPASDDLHEIGLLTNRIVNIFTTNVFSFAETEDVRVLKIAVDRQGNEKTNPFVVAAGFGSLPEVPVAECEVPEPLRVSEIPVVGEWTETFNHCTNLFPGSGNSCAWTNGVTLAHWQAFQDGVPPATLTRNQGAKNTVGLYAYWTADKSTDSYALGMNVGSDARTAVWGVAFTNDTALALKDFSLAYTGRQFGFKNTVAQAVAVEWRVVHELCGIGDDDGGGWHAVDALAFTTPAVGRGAELSSGVDTPLSERCAGALEGLRVAPGEVLLLRWKRTRVSNSAALGVDDVRLTWQTAKAPTLLVIR